MNPGICWCCSRYAPCRWRVWDDTTDELVWLCDVCEVAFCIRRKWRALTEAEYRIRQAELAEVR